MLKSLALRTNLMMDKYQTDIKQLDHFIIVTTPARPDYFWGNFAIYSGAPDTNVFDLCVETFEKNVGKRSELGFMAITFDWPEYKNKYFTEFVENGFKLTTSKVLTCEKIVMPKKLNKKIQVKEIDLEKDLETYVEVHFAPNWGYGPDDSQKSFLRDSVEEFKKFSQKANAKRFGAYLDGKAIAELGVYWEDGIARFNNVATHRNFRRLGACSTLVYKVSKLMLERNDIKVLVMEADEDYHAAAIYESVGFTVTEMLASLEWKDNDKFW